MINKSIIDGQDTEIKKIYSDFCIIQKDKYICPDNFNNLTVGWYFNEDRKNPNVEFKNDYDFYSLRNIKKGEELMVDYSTYSDDPA